MKSLKPIKDNNATPTLIAQSVADELRASLDALNAAIVNVNNQIADINAQLDVNAVNKESGAFDMLTARNAQITNKVTANAVEANDIKANIKITTPRVEADGASINSISSDIVSTHQASIDNLSVNNEVNTPVINTPTVNATNVNASNRVQTPNVTTDALNAPAAVIGELNVQTIRNVNNFNVDDVTVTHGINAPSVNATNVTVAELNANLAKMDALFTRNIEFVTDENDVSQYILLDPPTNSSNGNVDPVYIELPATSSGFYRINIKKQNGKYFAVTLINTETAPIVQYDKDEEADIDHIFYDTLTNKLYVKTYASGKIFWTNDSKTTVIAPKTYAELPIDASAETTLKYRAGGMRRLVIMGNNRLDYGLVVQGVLEATLIKESSAYHQLFFYGDSFEALQFLCDKFLKYEDPLTHQITYTTSQATGYLWHKDGTFRDSDNNEVEAIDYIKYDGSTITLGVNDRVGKDDIEMDASDVSTENEFSPYTTDLADVIAGEIAGEHMFVPDQLCVYTNLDTGEVYTDAPNHRYYIASVPGNNHPLGDVLYAGSQASGYNTIAATYGTGSESYPVNGYKIQTLDGSPFRLKGTPATLPFVLSFTLSSVAWDKAMNEEIFNSWGLDRS